MTTPPAGAGPRPLSRRRVESAAAAGVIYSICASIALVIVASIPSATDDGADWNDWVDGGGAGWLYLALNLAGFGAVAFLWFVAVIRRRLGEREDRFFATAFLGSALVYVGLWLVGMALVAAPALVGQSSATLSWESFQFADAASKGLLLVAAPRIQAVFVATSSTLFLRTEALPRWLAYFGYTAALSMFIVPVVTTPIGLALPVFVLVTSITVFFGRKDIAARATSGGVGGSDGEAPSDEPGSE